MTTPRLYVGTYAKYNSGSIAGAWLNLEDYADRDSFLEAAHVLHQDEADPELMFQDYEGFPRAFYSESSVPDALFDWIALDESDRELLAVYQEGIDEDATIDRARDAYAGTFDSESDWAADYLDSTGAMAECPEHLRNYIDYEAYARDARVGGDMVFVRHDAHVWVFHNR